MSYRCRVKIMGSKKASLGKATDQQKAAIKACKKGKVKRVKEDVSKKITKGYQQAANFVSNVIDH